MKTKKRLFAICFVVTGLMLAHAPEILVTSAMAANSNMASEDSAKAMIQSTVDTMLTTLNEHQQEIKNDPMLRDQYIRDIIFPHVDFLSFAKQVAKKDWPKVVNANKDKAFISALQEALSRTYAAALKSYDGNKVVVVGSKKNNNNTIAVQTEIQLKNNNQAPIKVVYLLKNTKGEWQVYDMVVSGISVSLSFHSALKNYFLKPNGIELAIESLKRNESSENKN